MEINRRQVALITGGSRGIGAATARAFAHRDCDIAITYRNKQARAEEVVDQVRQAGGAGVAFAADITSPRDVGQLVADLSTWRDHIDVLVLNASGGLERAMLAADPEYPMHINRDAQFQVLDGALPLMSVGGTIVFVTSHWAHLYGQMVQLPVYEPIAASKHAGESALRARQSDLTTTGLRLLVVTGDLIEGTITPKLLERAAPGLTAHRRQATGALPTAEDMGQAIADAALDPTLPSGHTVVIGERLDAMRGGHAD